MTLHHDITGQGSLEYKHSNASILSVIIKGIKLDKETTTVSHGMHKVHYAIDNDIQHT